MKFISIVAIALALSSPGAAKTLTIMNVDRVTFDDSRLNEQDLLRWLRLSPVVGAYNGYLVPPSITQCLVGDSRYVKCESAKEIPLESNAQVNIELIKEVLQDLQNGDYPTELTEVRSYLTRLQQFFLWRDSRLLEFMKTGNPSALEAPYESLDPKIVCGPVLSGIRAQQSAERRFSMGAVEWENCMWHAELQRVGEYPQEAWNKFLARYSIREEPIPETED